MSPAARACLQISLLPFIVFAVSGALKLTVTPDTGTTLIISSAKVKGCKVCRDAVPLSQQCGTSLTLKESTSVSVVFDCLTPQDVFTVEIMRNIECTANSCSGHIIQADSWARPFLGFNRKFTWNIRASEPNVLKIDFTTTGLRQIDPSQRCPDRHSYTLQAFQATGNVTLGKYCSMGTISSAQIQNVGSLSLDVPAGQELKKRQFNVSVGEEIKTFAKITLMHPSGSSSSELLTANYPYSFPDDDVMEWHFEVPDKHKTSVQFSNITEPLCLKKETAVEYHTKKRAALLLSLTEPQLDGIRGNFSLLLRNCEMDRRRPGSPGLLLCKVDMSELESHSLQIENLRPAFGCEMKINSVKKEKITVTSNSYLSFQDCSSDDVQVTAVRVIECHQLKDCPKTPVRLSVPVLPSCLPFPLSSVTWNLQAPLYGTVELTSPNRPLKQSLPGQPCNDSIIIKVAEKDGMAIGHFCPQGPIEKVQIHNYTSVTVSSAEGKELKMSFKHVLNASFKAAISERYLFTVSSKKDTPVLLATPPVPPNMEAHLVFANLSQPKCHNHHTDISVKKVNHVKLDHIHRGDEEAKSELIVSESFYLNMSNCNPKRGHFSVITKITLQNKNNNLLTIILSVVAAVVVIVVIVLVCVVMKKKKKKNRKKKPNYQVSIYNSNGTNFPKTRDQNESHVYASIEDTQVYTHLVTQDADAHIYGEFNTSPVAGHTDSQKPVVPKDTDADDMTVGVYIPFRFSSQQAPPLPSRPQSQLVVDTEIYQAEEQCEEEHSPNLGPQL
uniref:CUB domain-containing protein 1 n=1 Tax=Monopterus albus TaxID=43700 RepID=UPI0009B3EEC1|nr:CUB domain-containing protein 1 [Monopterus albus]